MKKKRVKRTLNKLIALTRSAALQRRKDLLLKRHASASAWRPDAILPLNLVLLLDHLRHLV